MSLSPTTTRYKFHRIMLTEIPLHDSVKVVDSLVGWMTRRKGYHSPFAWLRKDSRLPRTIIKALPFFPTNTSLCPYTKTSGYYSQMCLLTVLRIFRRNWYWGTKSPHSIYGNSPHGIPWLSWRSIVDQIHKWFKRSNRSFAIVPKDWVFYSMMGHLFLCWREL